MGGPECACELFLPIFAKERFHGLSSSVVEGGRPASAAKRLSSILCLDAKFYARTLCTELSWAAKTIGMKLTGSHGSR
jgi:hypothetical protein